LNHVDLPQESKQGPRHGEGPAAPSTWCCGGELNSEIEHAANPTLKTQTSLRRRFKAFVRRPKSPIGFGEAHLVQ
jgi:hypothetical protein